MATYQTYPGHGPDWMNGPRTLETGVAYRVPRFDPENPGHIRLRRLERVAWLLDRAVPIGGFRVGLDPIIGLIPGLGDSVGALLSLYVLYEGARLGAPGYILVRMTGNILIEAILGAVPVLGDVFDFVWQANSRNMRLIHKYHNPGWQPRSMRTVWFSVAIAAAVVLMVVIFLAWSVFSALTDLVQRV